MPRKLSKRKQPDRDIHLIHEVQKIENGVFDKKTLMILAKFFNHKIVSELMFVISTGKEANAYLAKSGDSIQDEFVVLKIFRVQNSNFQNRIKYMQGDPRFGTLNKKMQSIVTLWCKKEFGNLKIAYELGVAVPRPIKAIDNVLAMEFIYTSNGSPAPMLKDITLNNPTKVLDEIIKNIGLLYKGKMVHSDLSEYNILIKNVDEEEKAVFIDMGQAIVYGHPKFEEYLKRDVSVILAHFSKKYKIDNSLDQVLEKIKL
ncbi:MAG: serine protein kinase RIO [Candidatus Micrarchaeia archaeon]